MPKFNVKLMQRELVHAETFEIEAENEKSAESKAEAFVTEHKDLENKEYQLIVEAQPEPVAEEEALDFSDDPQAPATVNEEESSDGENESVPNHRR